MQRIEEMSDADVSEVRESAALFRGVEDTTADLRRLLDFLCGMRWLTAGMKTKERNTFWAAVTETLGHEPAGAFALLSQGPAANAIRRLPATRIRPELVYLRATMERRPVHRRPRDLPPLGGRLPRRVAPLAGRPAGGRLRRRHRQPALGPDQAPGGRVVRDPRAGAGAGPDRGRPEGLHPAATRTGRLDCRRLRHGEDRADNLGQLVRASGHYPLLGGGDVNLYSLFVERAMSLVKPDGFVGLLTPSGIYADKTAANFFKSVSTSGRVAGLFDFENRRLGTDLPPFFPDVDSRFKFCALVFRRRGPAFRPDPVRLLPTRHPDDQGPGGAASPWRRPTSSVSTPTPAPLRSSAPAGTPTSPAAFTSAIPSSSTGHRVQERRAWPVRYRTMFHMTNDSYLFRTAAELDAEGFYPVQGNRWKRADELYLPLYQGRMVRHFDHRGPLGHCQPGEHAQSLPEQEGKRGEEHADPNFLPKHSILGAGEER